MTTIKDYLRDLVKAGETLKEEAIRNKLTYQEIEDREEEIVDEYTDIIAKRIVGAEY